MALAHDSGFLWAGSPVNGAGTPDQPTSGATPHEWREAEDAVGRHKTFAELLDVVAVATNEAATLGEGIESVLEAVCVRTGWPVGHAFLYDVTEGSLRSTRAWYVADRERYRQFQIASERTVLQAGHGLPGRVLAEGRPASMSDLACDPNFPRSAAAQAVGLRSGFGFPVLCRREVVAILEFFSPASDPLPNDVLRVMSSVAMQLGRVVERERAATNDAKSENRFRALVEHMSDPIAVVDARGVIACSSPSTATILGLSTLDLEGRDALGLIHPDDRPRARKWLERATDRRSATPPLELRLDRPDGTPRTVEVVANDWLDDVQDVVIGIRDISEGSQAEDPLAQAGLHDSLTGLPGRALFEDLARRAIARGRRNAWSTAVFAVDIDGFRDVDNDVGREAGEGVVVEAARRLQAVLRPYDSVGRPFENVGHPADQFFLLCEHVEDHRAASGIAGRISKSFEEPVELGGISTAISTRIGIALVGPVGAEPDRVIGDAEAALRRSKTRGAGMEEFSDGMPSDARENDMRKRERELQQAIATGQLRVHYQPKILLSNDRVIGVEGLVRWQHPSLGLVPPLRFIPLAEETGLIVPLGAWVLREACRQARTWDDSFPGRPHLAVSVNVSARQFQSGLVGTVAEVLAETGIEPSRLCLEVTESIVMENVESAIETLDDLKALGVMVSIDDFGTGYSSLAYLKRFPLDELKIDRSFVDGLGAKQESTAIVAAIIAMAHALGLSVVAEGVETAEQLERLRMLGCEQVQGYYFSRPLSVEELGGFLVAEDAMSARRGHTGADDPEGGYRPEVVVVADDSAQVLQLARVSLRTAGFEVHEAENGRAALALARAVKPDCVILDVRMPEMDGFQACRAIRDDATLAGCTIVMLTANAEPEDKIEGFSAGADDYIVKPFAPRDLVSRVRTAVRRRREQSLPGGRATGW